MNRKKLKNDFRKNGVELKQGIKSFSKKSSTDVMSQKEILRV